MHNPSTSPYVSQLRHNELFHNSLVSNFPDIYFDWKITCTFYCAIHLLKALGEHNHINLGENHKDIFKNISPDNPSRLLPIKKKAFEAYAIIFDYSRIARYNGIFDPSVFEKMRKSDYQHCRHLYDYLRKYITMERSMKI